MEEETENSTPHGWNAIADVTGTLAAVSFVLALLSLRTPGWSAIWFSVMAILLIGAGKLRAWNEARQQREEGHQRNATERRNKKDRERRNKVRAALAETVIVITAERIITLTELGAHVAIQFAVKDILEKHPTVVEEPMPGKEFLAKMDRRVGRPQINRDIDALYGALTEEPVEQSA
jgi:flagellar biosynthesis component FlhA